MSAHTATPWRVLKAKDSSGDFGIGCIVDRALLAEVFTDIRENGERSPEGAANAEFIVRAVNAHDALVAAVKLALEVAPANNYRERDALRAALAKASA